MKKILILMFVLCMMLAQIDAAAGDLVTSDGEVLYHQNFSDQTSFAECGIRIGTLSSQAASVNISNDSLVIRPGDSGRVYAILPTPDKTDSASYTLEFSFRFSDSRTENASLAVMLTCRDAEPNNITSVVFRVDGTVDEFEEVPLKLAAAVGNGQKISVRIPIVDGLLNAITLTAGEESYTLNRKSLLRVESGNMGFAVRNADVEIPEIFLVHGAEYEEKIGYYAENSYAEDGAPMVGSADDAAAPEELSPETGEALIGRLAAAILSLSAAAGIAKRKRKEK